jgi:hypothetical protein
MALPFVPTTLQNQLALARIFLDAFTRAEFPFLLNAQNVIRNNLHSLLAGGRGGYFWDSAGPTEGQALMGKACFLAHKASGDPAWLTKGLAVTQALVDYFYLDPIPANPTSPADTPWLSHWLINAGPDPVPSKGLPADNPFEMGHFFEPFTFTGGVAQLPSTLADLYKVATTDAEPSFKSVFAPLKSGSLYPFSYWVANLGLVGQNFRVYPDTATAGGTPPTPTSEPAGKVVLASNFSGTALVTYSRYRPDIPIGVNKLAEPYPLWYPIQRAGLPTYMGTAWDAIWWSWDAFQEAYNLTQDLKWKRAADATKFTAINAATVDNPSFYYPKSADPNPFSYPGTQVVTANNRSLAVGSRVTSGNKTQFLQVSAPGQDNPAIDPDYAYPSYEVQNFIVLTNFDTSTTRVFIECAHSDGGQQDDFVYTGSLEVVLSTSSDPFDLTQQFKCPLLLPASNGILSKILVRSDFLRWSTIRNVWWSTSADDPIYTYSGNGDTIEKSIGQELINGNTALVWQVDMTHNGTGGFAGFGFPLIHAQTADPPGFMYAQDGDTNIKIVDGNNKGFICKLPDTGGNWKYFKPSWSQFTPFLSNSTPSGTIQSVEVIARGSETSTKVWYVGEPGEPLPPGLVYKASVVSRTKTPHTFWVGDFKPLSNNLDSLLYNPGVVSFTVNTIETAPGSGVRKKDSWGGPPYTGYQDPYHWAVWGYQQRASQVVTFIKDAQTAYTAQSAAKLRGLVSPVFLWAYWDSADFRIYGNGQINVFVFNGPDPNTRWGPYTYRAMEALARYLLINPSDLTARGILTAFFRFILQYYKSAGSNRAITDIPPVVNPQVNYREPHAGALICRAALYANVAGLEPAVTFELMQRTLADMDEQFVGSGVMAGSWSASQPTFTYAGTEYREYFGFWQAEIIITLSQLLLYQAQINDPAVSGYSSAGQAGVYPNLPPHFLRSFDMPAYKQNINRFDEGTEQRIKTSHTGVGTKLVLGYEKISDGQVRTLVEFWKASRGKEIPFTLPSTVLNHPALIVAALAGLTSTTYWRFSEAPQVETEVATTERGLYNVDVMIQSVIS